MWSGVSKENLPENWGVFEPLVEEVLAHTQREMTSRDVLCELLAGKWALWVVGKDKERWGIVITRIYDFYQKRFCEITMAAVRPGYTFKEMREEFEPILSDWARAHECDALRMITSRKGLRAAAGPDWKEVYVEMEKSLWASPAAATPKQQSNPTNPGPGNSHS